MDSLLTILVSSINSPASIALALGVMLFTLVLGLISYIYLSFVFFSIGKRCKVLFPRLALIPVIGPMLISFSIANMSYLPWIGFVIFSFGMLITIFLVLNTYLIVISLLAFAVFFVYLIIWNMRMFRNLKRSASWAYSLLFFPLYFVLVGIAARKPSIN